MAFFDIVRAGAGDDFVDRLCGAAVEATVTRVVEKKLPAHNTAAWVGGIVTAAGFPEFGLPIVVAGHLLGRWRAQLGARAAQVVADVADRISH